MALEASHIRFALDLKDKYKVLDLKKYVSGAIYPDSRYVTQLDRLAAHPDLDYAAAFLNRDDFYKGWYAHLLADNIQHQITKEWLPEIFEGQAGQGSEVWIKHTALKIIQDLDDVKKFDIVKHLTGLEYVLNPNGEDSEMVLKYNRIFQKMYKDLGSLNIDSFYHMWKLFGVGEELSLAVKDQAEKYSQDPRVMEIVLKIYPEMIKRAESV